MTNYKKMQNADLETLLKLRGLSTNGTKTQRVGRLIMQDKEDEAEAKAIDARVKIASTSTPTDNVPQHGMQVGRGPGPGTLHRRGGGQVRRPGTRKGKGKSTSGETGVESGANKVHDGKENASLEHDQEAYIKSLLGANRNTAPAKKTASPGIFVNMTPESLPAARTSATPDLDSPISRKEVAVDKDTDLDTSEDSKAAVKVFLCALLISAVTMLVLQGFTLDDFRQVMLGAKSWVRNPVHAMKGSIFGDSSMDQRGTVGDRVRSLFGIVSEIMRAGWEELIEDVRDNN